MRGHALIAERDLYRGKPNRASLAAVAAIVVFIAQVLGACSGVPSTTTAAYENLNEPAPRRDPSVDQDAASAKAELTSKRDKAARAASHQQALH